jgi:PLP dependent protein
LRERLALVGDRIRRAAENSGRDPKDIRLVVVSKTQGIDRVRAALKAGAMILGENYIQEARNKIMALEDNPASWHFIGHLQKNKAKVAVRLFDLIHSVDSLDLAAELDRQAARIGKVQDILIQVNVGDDPAKSGISASEAIPMASDIGTLRNLSIKGLMTMPPFFNDPERARPCFSALRDLRDQLVDRALPHVSMDELSMGMTGDFEVALEEGATLVRIGTAIFGERR